MLAEVQRLSADVQIVVVERLDDLRQGEAGVVEPLEVDAHVVGLALAAPAVDVDDARHRLEAPFELPIFNRSQVGHRIALRSDDPVSENLADRAPWRYLRIDSLWQRRQLGELVDRRLLRLVIGDVISELQLDVRKAEQRNRADRRNVGNPRHLDFQRDGDVALHLFRRLARVLCDDVDKGRDRIRIGLDVEAQKADQSGGADEDEQRDHQRLLLQREGDDAVHCPVPANGAGVIGRSGNRPDGLGSVALRRAVNEQPIGRLDILAERQSFDHFDHAVTDASGADGARRYLRA